MTKYTPEPWELGTLITNEGQKPIMGPDTGPDAPGNLKRVALVDCQTRFKRGTGWKTECAEREANAHLIAAAPKLLAFAKAFMNTSPQNSHKLLAQAMAAIAKATGNE